MPEQSDERNARRRRVLVSADNNELHACQGKMFVTVKINANADKLSSFIEFLFQFQYAVYFECAFFRPH